MVCIRRGEFQTSSVQWYNVLSEDSTESSHNPIKEYIMGGYISPVNSEVGKYTTGQGGQSYGDIMSLFGGDAKGWNDIGPGFNSQGSNGLLGGNMWQNIGAGADVFNNLFGLYEGVQGLKMAKTQMNNRADLSNYNMANRTTFLNKTNSAFGGSGNIAQNRFAQKV